ncbi:MAG: type II toxin-antitoxin system RelE/ParE family toxin [Bacteroidia bacterium]|nr:type II toxin-antitoxin system RelE/ParE family toxin [Bacteroidia bacterium]
MKERRKIIFFRNYFPDFYINQSKKIQEKIDYVFAIIKNVERVPEKFLKHIEGTKGLFEIRVEQGNNIFRIFCCFDHENIVVLFNAFQKKTEKTPKNEIELALKYMTEYFKSKEIQQ